MIIIILYDGYSVSEKLYKAVLYQVEEIIPAMEDDVKYTLKILCGDEFWDLLTDGEKRMAGRCMAHMVVNKRLPLSFSDSKHEYPKWYRIH